MGKAQTSRKPIAPKGAANTPWRATDPVAKKRQRGAIAAPTAVQWEGDAEQWAKDMNVTARIETIGREVKRWYGVPVSIRFNKGAGSELSAYFALAVTTAKGAEEVLRAERAIEDELLGRFPEVDLCLYCFNYHKPEDSK